ncbi:hypothetical protein A3D45_03005 [Candidatus Falkowbacteria bacterium RIFCSPHIGHO2_02_FULL_42_9]|uniref:Uncharacterized protein n=1 Tax=Candidatus Falkowbacteria bacterium RIFCSPHIGHO2_02_FULL_42_9 TaxID=1797986 RepID=A0A1F5S699_9BACT|nr:MAG: hypothetical protein A3D45_03005 [Candidatus Falkowbacteria bacterium RIFCSPHIGHO2_02_FULL_42_9]
MIRSLKKHAHSPGQHGKNYHDADDCPKHFVERFLFHIKTNLIIIAEVKKFILSAYKIVAFFIKIAHSPMPIII